MKDYYKMNSVETAVMMKAIEQSRQTALVYDEMEPLSWGLYQAGLKVDGVSYSESIAGWDRLAADTDTFFTAESLDLLLMPSTNGVAPLQDQFKFSPHQEDSLRQMALKTYEEQQEIIWNIFEKWLSSTCLPTTKFNRTTGYQFTSVGNKAGLPIGVQFSARKGEDYTLLQVALELEQQGFLIVEHYYLMTNKKSIAFTRYVKAMLLNRFTICQKFNTVR